MLLHSFPFSSGGRNLGLPHVQQVFYHGETFPSPGGVLIAQEMY